MIYLEISVNDEIFIKDGVVSESYFTDFLNMGIWREQVTS